METMEPIQEPPQCEEGRQSQNTAENDLINGNDENENMSTKRIHNQSKTMKSSGDTNNSSLNPNALPFYPLQQVQNLNSNVDNTVYIVNENANHNFNANIKQVYNMNAISNAPMFHQLANQILVLRLPTGLPIRNQAGIQIPQMIIPLQIPVPVPQDHDYYLPPPTVVLQESLTTMSGSSPMSVSPFEGIEITRHSSPIPFELPSTDSMDMTQVGCVSTPEIARTSPIKKTEEESNIDNSASLTNNSRSQEALNSESIPRFKIPSPTKMTTRSRGRKPVEREKRPIEEPGSLPSQSLPENLNKSSTKRIIKAKKSKPITVKVKSEEISLAENKATISNEQTASEAKPALELGSEIEIPVINEAMDYAAERQIDTEFKLLNESLIPLTGKKNPKNKSKATKTAKSKVTKNKNQSTIVEIKNELPDISETANNFCNKTIKTEPIKRELNEVEQGSIKIENPTIKIKKEETVKIKSEPLSGNDTLLELPDLDIDDEELPIINTKARNSTFVPSTSACAEESEFQKEVEHYSKPEVQCQIFFPKLVVKRSQVRGDNCVVEYAVSGRSHCRICKTTIKKEELRFSIPVRERDFGYNTVIDTWHHARCFWGAYKLRSTYNMTGFQYLSQSDQKLIQECIQQLK